jgi:hypothetical protein
MLPSTKLNESTVDPARRVELEILFPGPTLHPGPITTFGPINEDGSIYADTSISTFPLILFPDANTCGLNCLSDSKCNVYPER